MIARTGRTSVLARLMFAQIAQKSPAGPDGFFCGEDGVPSAEAFPLSAAAQAGEPMLSSPTCTWPNESTSWQANAKNANHATPPRFDRNQPIHHPLWVVKHDGKPVDTQVNST
jgi:hypothetical protein